MQYGYHPLTEMCRVLLPTEGFAVGRPAQILLEFWMHQPSSYVNLTATVDDALFLRLGNKSIPDASSQRETLSWEVLPLRAGPTHLRMFYSDTTRTNQPCATATATIVEEGSGWGSAFDGPARARLLPVGEPATAGTNITLVFQFRTDHSGPWDPELRLGPNLHLVNGTTSRAAIQLGGTNITLTVMPEHAGTAWIEAGLGPFPGEFVPFRGFALHVEAGGS